MIVGSIHTHSDYSLHDGAASPSEIVARIKEMGGSAVASTEHGNMASVWDYIDACKKADIKYVPGCEFYVDDGEGGRIHLIALAKNFTGYQAISKCCTASAYNIHNDRPIVTMDMLQEWFAPGTKGYGNVIFTSACVIGILASVVLINEKYQKQIDKVEKKRKSVTNEDNPLYKSYVEQIKALEDEEASVKKDRDDYDKLAKKAWQTKLDNAKKSGDDETIRLAEEFRDSVLDALAKATECRARLKVIAALKKDVKKKLEPLKKEVEKWQKYTEEIEEIKNHFVSDDEIKVRLKEKVEYYIDLLGKDNFFIEVQNHGLDMEKEAYPVLASLAEEYNLPVVASNDVHVATKDQAERKHLNFVQYQKNPWTEMEPDDYEYYIKSDEELAESLLDILPENIVNKAIGNIKEIFDRCDVKFEVETHYPKFPCECGAKIHLRNLIKEGKSKVANWTDVYQKRLQYELNVIEKMGFSDYLCIINDFLKYARIIGKLDLTSPEFLENPFDIKKLKKLAEGKVGEGCGPGRGSAAGSLVCYLVDITNIDPIENDLMFERFLNPQRVTMPDVDSDIAPDVRPWVIEYIKHRYGAKSVCQISTRGFFGAKSAIQAGARALGKQRGDDKAFVSVSVKMSKSIEDAETSIKDAEEKIKAEFGTNKDALTILEYAKQLEGLMQNFGTHAAGIIISDNGDVSDYVPLMAVGDAIDCQCDLNMVEPLGMLKLDLLGLRNLGIITECEKEIQKTTGEMISMDSLPVRKEVFTDIFSKGLTDGVFQFESDGMKNTLKKFGPESISDLTLLNAIFRPGPLQYIDEVTAVKKKEKTPKYIIPEMEEILGPTYSKPIYQEEIIAIFNKIAGFSLGEADIIRRHMAKKHFDEFAAYKDKFVEGMMANGAAKEDVEKFWDELLEFSSYAFNKSHSRAYVEIAYTTAYFKKFYPAAYSVGLLNYSPNEKLGKFIEDTKNMGVKIVPPDINRADSKFTLYENEVVFGLGSIVQVAASATEIINERNTNGEFKNFVDFVQRTSLRKNVVENLIKAGAFDSLHNNRRELLESYPDIAAALFNIKEYRARIINETSDKKIEKYQNVIDEATLKLENPFKSLEEIRQTRLLAEKEVLNYFISEHPMDNVRVTTPCLKEVAAGTDAKVTVFVDNISIKYTKKDNRPFASFSIEDATEEMEAVIFPTEYNRFNDLIKEDVILVLTGSVKVNDREERQFVVKTVSVFSDDSNVVEVHVNSYKEWEELMHSRKIDPFKNNDGYILRVFCDVSGTWVDYAYRVSPDIKKELFHQ